MVDFLSFVFFHFFFFYLGNFTSNNKFITCRLLGNLSVFKKQIIFRPNLSMFICLAEQPQQMSIRLEARTPSHTLLSVVISLLLGPSGL